MILRGGHPLDIEPSLQFTVSVTATLTTPRIYLASAPHHQFCDRFYHHHVEDEGISMPLDFLPTKVCFVFKFSSILDCLVH